MCANPLLLDPHDHCHVSEERNCPRRAPASPGPSRRGRITDSCSAFTVTTEPRSPPPAWELLSSPCAQFQGRRGSCQRSGVALGNGSHPSCRFRPLPRRPLSAALRLCVSRLFSSLCHVVNCAPCGFLLRTGSQTLPSASPLSRFRFVLFLTRGANPMAWTFSESEENGMVFVPRFFVYRLTLKHCLSFLPQNVYVCN